MGVPTDARALSFFATMEAMANARSTLATVLLFVWMTAPALRCLLPGIPEQATTLHARF